VVMRMLVAMLVCCMRLRITVRRLRLRISGVGFMRNNENENCAKHSENYNVVFF